MPIKDTVAVLEHPKGKMQISKCRADVWAKKGTGVYMDRSKTTIRFLGYENRLLFPKLGMAMRPLDANWNVSELPADARGALFIARHEANRRAREANAIGAHSEAEWQQILSKFGHRCLRCHIHATQTYFGKLTKDHVIPLASGGTDFASNLQPLCRRCNSWKGNREIDFRTNFQNESLSANPKRGSFESRSS